MIQRCFASSQHVCHAQEVEESFRSVVDEFGLQYDVTDDVGYRALDRHAIGGSVQHEASDHLGKNAERAN
jgi:hypothetical protein